MKSELDVAKELAQAHLQDDPGTTDVFFAEAEGEVHLVEVSGSVGPSTPKEVLPVKFAARPDKGVVYPSVVVLLSPEEWEAVNRGELQLPSGWNKNALKKIA